MFVENSQRTVTYSTASLQGCWHGVNSQDMAELVPIFNVLLIRPIQIAKLHLHGSGELLMSSFSFLATTFPLVCLAQTFKF